MGAVNVIATTIEEEDEDALDDDDDDEVVRRMRMAGADDDYDDEARERARLTRGDSPPLNLILVMNMNLRVALCDCGKAYKLPGSEDDCYPPPTATATTTCPSTAASTPAAVHAPGSTSGGTAFAFAGSRSTLTTIVNEEDDARAKERY